MTSNSLIHLKNSLAPNILRSVQTGAPGKGKSGTTRQSSLVQKQTRHLNVSRFVSDLKSQKAKDVQGPDASYFSKNKLQQASPGIYSSIQINESGKLFSQRSSSDMPSRKSQNVQHRLTQHGLTRKQTPQPSSNCAVKSTPGKQSMLACPTQLKAQSTTQSQIDISMMASQLQANKNYQKKSMWQKNMGISQTLNPSSSPGLSTLQAAVNVGGHLPRKNQSKKDSNSRRRQFLNVDSITNAHLLGLIDSSNQDFDFSGLTQYVINASELSNQDLNSVLYSVEVQAPLNIAQQFPQDEKRSRNSVQLLTAGQSVHTQSFCQGTSMQQAVSNRANSSYYETIKAEVQMHDDVLVYQLLPDYAPAKYSSKGLGHIKAYGANTHQGISRNYNEDRVAIILNIMKPQNSKISDSAWPNCSFFGVYDGHGGQVCADFLRDYLHQLDENFPVHPVRAIRNGFAEAERLFLEYAQKQEHEVGEIDKSGSCATVALIIDEMCYVANTGDSRAVLSASGGRQIMTLSNDHKPTDPLEADRIIAHNGRIYQNTQVISESGRLNVDSRLIIGPHRVFPGRLSVCRTLGDLEAKQTKQLGNPRIVVSDPDIAFFRLQPCHDFIVLCCDGVVDKLDDTDVVHTVWQSVGSQAQRSDSRGEPNDSCRHDLAGRAVDALLKTSALRRSGDNLTAVFIAFKSYFEQIELARGEISYFEHPSIELVRTDLLLPHQKSPMRMCSDGNEIRIEEEFSQQSNGEPSNSSFVNYTGQLVGDTGDSAFSELQKQGQLEAAQQNLSDIAEEDLVSLISERQRREQTNSYFYDRNRGDPLQKAIQGPLLPPKTMPNNPSKKQPLHQTVPLAGDPGPLTAQSLIGKPTSSSGSIVVVGAPKQQLYRQHESASSLLKQDPQTQAKQLPAQTAKRASSKRTDLRQSTKSHSHFTRSQAASTTLVASSNESDKPLNQLAVTSGATLVAKKHAATIQVLRPGSGQQRLTGGGASKQSTSQFGKEMTPSDPSSAKQTFVRYLCATQLHQEIGMPKSHQQQSAKSFFRSSNSQIESSKYRVSSVLPSGAPKSRNPALTVSGGAVTGSSLPISKTTWSSLRGPSTQNGAHDKAYGSIQSSKLYQTSNKQTQGSGSTTTGTQYKAVMGSNKINKQ